jgi:hypothetical protein
MRFSAYAEDWLKRYSLRCVYRFISIERISFTEFQPRHSSWQYVSNVSRVTIGDLRVRATTEGMANRACCI